MAYRFDMILSIWKMVDKDRPHLRHSWRYDKSLIPGINSGAIMSVMPDGIFNPKVFSIKNAVGMANM